MIKALNKLNIYYQVALFTIIISSVLLLVCIPCYFFGFPDIPQGFVLGGLLSSIFYIVQGLIDKKENETCSHTGSIIIMISRFAVFIGLLILLAFMYYAWNYKFFNLFSFIGGYVVGVIVLVILMIKGKDLNDSK